MRRLASLTKLRSTYLGATSILAGMEPDVLGHVDAVLERLDVREHEGIAVVVLLREQMRQLVGRLLHEVRDDLDGLGAVRRILEPPHGADMVFEEVLQGFAVLLQEVGAGRQEDKLRRAYRVLGAKQHLVLAALDELAGLRLQHRAHVHLALVQHRRDVRERDLHDRIVALVVHVVLLEHRPDGGVGRRPMALLATRLPFMSATVLMPKSARTMKVSEW